MPGQLTVSTISDGTNSTSATNAIQGSAKAWVNFNGADGSRRASHNVSSVTRNGTGDYTVNFTNAMPDANYSVAGIGMTDSVSYTAICQIKGSSALATDSVRLDYYEYNNAGVKRDPGYCLIAVFR